MAKYSNSKLVKYTKLSPNYNNRGGRKILKITPHHMAGNMSVEACGDLFASGKKEASSNYGIGTDGRIAMYVEEKNRAWTSGSPDNDYQAITIEVANDGGEPDWHVSDKALASLIDLCVDICKRNGIAKLNYTGDASGNLTMHKYFAATGCPGPYLASKFPYIANEVNKRLGVKDVTTSPSKSSTTSTNKKFKVGDKVKFKNARQYNGGSIPSAYKNKEYTISQINGDRVVLNIGDNVMYAVNINDIVSSGKEVTSATIKVGDKVKFKSGATQYNGNSIPSAYKSKEYTVSEISGDRAVLNIGNNVMYAVKVSNIQAVGKKAEASKFKEFMIRTSQNPTKIRKGPGEKYEVAGEITKKGVYTIIAQDGKWGKLKSGAGWIDLTYTTKV